MIDHSALAREIATWLRQNPVAKWESIIEGILASALQETPDQIAQLEQEVTRLRRLLEAVQSAGAFLAHELFQTYGDGIRIAPMLAQWDAACALASSERPRTGLDDGLVAAQADPIVAVHPCDSYTSAFPGQCIVCKFAKDAHPKA